MGRAPRGKTIACNTAPVAALMPKPVVGKPRNALDRVDAVDGLAYAVRFQVRGVRQDPPMFRALVALVEGKEEELRTMAANILAPIRDGEFRGDLGRPERKAPEGGWAAWLDAITVKDAAYRQGYAACGSTAAGKAAELFCQGGPLLGSRPDQGFALTLQAAEMGHLPARAKSVIFDAKWKTMSASANADSNAAWSRMSARVCSTLSV